jgi:hypothetical protein
MKHAQPTVGRTARILSGLPFFRKQSAIIAQSRNPPLGDVSCRHCGEDDETGIHIICDCGHFVQHRLNTIGVYQMPEDKPEWDMESMFQFLRKEEIIRALLAASVAKFNIAPVRWQHPSHVAIVPPESKGKTEGNDWETACGNFKTSISSIYHIKKCVSPFSLPK